MFPWLRRRPTVAPPRRADSVPASPGHVIATIHAGPKAWGGRLVVRSDISPVTSILPGERDLLLAFVPKLRFFVSAIGSEVTDEDER